MGTRLSLSDRLTDADSHTCRVSLADRLTDADAHTCRVSLADRLSRLFRLDVYHQHEQNRIILAP